MGLFPEINGARIPARLPSFAFSFPEAYHFLEEDGDAHRVYNTFDRWFTIVYNS
jgi:hypothetical protein